MPPVRQKCAAKELNINVYSHTKGRQVISEGQRMRKQRFPSHTYSMCYTVFTNFWNVLLMLIYHRCSWWCLVASELQLNLIFCASLFCCTESTYLLAKTQACAGGAHSLCFFPCPLQLVQSVMRCLSKEGRRGSPCGAQWGLYAFTLSHKCQSTIGLRAERSLTPICCL